MSRPIGAEAAPQGGGPAMLLNLGPRRLGEATEMPSPEGFAALLAGIFPEPAPGSAPAPGEAARELAAPPGAEPSSALASTGSLPWAAFAEAAEETARLASAFQWAAPSPWGKADAGMAPAAMPQQPGDAGAGMPAAEPGAPPGTPSIFSALPEGMARTAMPEAVQPEAGSGPAPLLSAPQEPLAASAGEMAEPAPNALAPGRAAPLGAEAAQRPASGAAPEASRPAIPAMETGAAILPVALGEAPAPESATSESATSESAAAESLAKDPPRVINSIPGPATPAAMAAATPLPALPPEGASRPAPRLRVAEDPGRMPGAARATPAGAALPPPAPGEAMAAFSPRGATASLPRPVAPGWSEALAPAHPAAPPPQEALPPALPLAAPHGLSLASQAEGPAPAMAPPRPSQAAQAAPQIVLRVAQAAREGVESISVDLRPPELGRVELRLTFRDGTVQVLLCAEQPETLEALRQERHNLVQQMEQAGIQLGGGGLDLQQGRLPRPEPEPPLPLPPAAGVEGEAAALDETAARPRRPASDSLIDITA